jgi:hypothetical protein
LFGPIYRHSASVTFVILTRALTLNAYGYPEVEILGNWRISEIIPFE